MRKNKKAEPFSETGRRSSTGASVQKPLTRFTEPPILAFFECAGSPKAIIALWKMWREDKDYGREWEVWRSIERAAKAVKESEDRLWQLWENKPNSKEKSKALHKANSMAAGRCDLVRQCLDGFAGQFGIPPLNPKSKKIEQEVQAAIARWSVGKFWQAAWEITPELKVFADTFHSNQNKSSELGLCVYVCVTARMTDIQKAVRAIVEDARPRNWQKWKWPTQAAQQELYDYYAKAWYLRDVKKQTPSEIAHTLFGKGGKVFTRKARLYAAAGQQLHEGTPHLIRGKKTPGWRPERDEREQTAVSKALEDVIRKQGVKDADNPAVTARKFAEARKVGGATMQA